MVYIDTLYSKCVCLCYLSQNKKHILLELLIFFSIAIKFNAKWIDDGKCKHTHTLIRLGPNSIEIMREYGKKRMKERKKRKDDVKIQRNFASTLVLIFVMDDDKFLWKEKWQTIGKKNARSNVCVWVSMCSWMCFIYGELNDYQECVQACAMCISKSHFSI